MKHRSAYLVVFLLASAATMQVHALSQAAGGIHARGIYHPDGSRTESVKDPQTRVLTETTYNSGGTVVSRHVYQLNEQGQVMQGNIYDGRDTLVAREQSWFDEFGRLKESRLMNLQGETFQQTLYEYGANEKPKKPKVINYNVRTPMMRPAVVDYTGVTQPPPAAGGQPQTVTSGPPMPAADDKPKRGFFGRLFGKKEKK